MNLAQLLAQGDTVTRAVALLLLAMSVASWVVILHKGWALRAAGRSLPDARRAFWAAPSLADAQSALAPHDRQALLRPLIAAAQAALAPPAGALAAQGDAAQRLTRALRDALQALHGRLHFGQVLLASVGATAPFVGLLGTVWGIFHALTGIADAGQISIDKVSGPVGEALVMTAAGLAVAIPAVIGYNVYGRWIGRIEAELDGFAHDLRDLLAPGAVPAAADAPETA